MGGGFRHVFPPPTIIFCEVIILFNAGESDDDLRAAGLLMDNNTSTSGLDPEMISLYRESIAQERAAVDAQIKAERQNAAKNFEYNKYLQEQNLNAMQASADKEMAFNAEQAELSRAFSSKEALADRNWQEYMSSTAYQRAVKDLQAAGLNPMLAVMQGGASTPSGSTAQSSQAYGGHISSSPASASKASAMKADMSGITKSVMSMLTSKLDRENSQKLQSQYLSAMQSVARMQTQASMMNAGLSVGSSIASSLLMALLLL